MAIALARGKEIALFHSTANPGENSYIKALTLEDLLFPHTKLRAVKL